MAGIAISTIFGILFLRNTDFDGVANAFTEANIELILVGIVIYLIGIYFRAVRWAYLISPIKRIPPYKLFPIVSIGHAANNVLPFRAGEIIRAHVLHQRYEISRTTGLSTIFIARVFDGMMLTIFLVIGITAGITHYQGMAFAGYPLLGVMVFLVFGVSAAFVILYMISAHPAGTEKKVRRLVNIIPRFRNRKTSWVQSIINGFTAVRSPQLFFAGAWTSCVAWGLEAFTYFLVGEAFGLDQPFPVYLLVAAAANIIISAPSTAGGVGPFEWAAKEILLIYLIVEGSDELATAYAASLHGLVLVPVSLLGLWFLWWSQIPFIRLIRGQTR